MAEKKKIEVSEIHSNVPIPVNQMKFPWNDIEVDQMFEFPIKKRPSVQSRATFMNKTTDRTFVVRKINDTTGGVWRTK